MKNVDTYFKNHYENCLMGIDKTILTQTQAKDEFISYLDKQPKSKVNEYIKNNFNNIQFIDIYSSLDECEKERPAWLLIGNFDGEVI